ETNTDGSVRRCVREIAAVVPSLRDGATFEPVFVARDGALVWTGAWPARLAARIDPSVRAQLEMS
ncbi:MAG TPA: hypothetical protein VFR41_03850, partial [Acidimicrobiia bacterium]|nr:hypothetical protein [Acidimicrobiia bacterium]